MIKINFGQLIKSRAQVLVNVTNASGGDNRGVNRLFAVNYPANQSRYESYCKKGFVQEGHAVILDIDRSDSDDSSGSIYIANIAIGGSGNTTANIDFVRQALYELKHFIVQKKIKSVAIPAIGCDHNKLNWGEVRQEIIDSISVLEDVELFLYSPFCEQ